MFVLSFGSIKSKQWENSHPVKVSLSVINHQINSERSEYQGLLRVSNSASIGDPKKVMTNAATAIIILKM